LAWVGLPGSSNSFEARLQLDLVIAEAVHGGGSEFSFADLAPRSGQHTASSIRQFGPFHGLRFVVAQLRPFSPRYALATAAADQAEPGRWCQGRILASLCRNRHAALSPRRLRELSSALSHRARSGWSTRRRAPMPSTVLRVAQIPYGCGPYGPRDTALIPTRLAGVAIGALPL
jgi:hypothetical protein